MRKFLTLAGLFGMTLPAAGTNPPNVLIIIADDLGFSDLGCYGGEIATPNLDQLAEGGLRFSQFYNTARCWPTRASLLTGFYAQQVRRDKLPGIESGGGGTRPDWALLLPDYLEPLGYRSYHTGKWHVDSTPLKAGFDRSYWIKDQSRFFSPTVHFLDDRKLPAVDEDSGFYATIAAADHAIECLKSHAAEHGDQPFFTYLAFSAPHFPLHALPEDIDRYREVYREGWEAIRAARAAKLRELGLLKEEPSAVEVDLGPPYDFPEHLEQLGAGEVNRPLPWDELTEEQQAFQATKMAIHAAMVDRMDREIGRVLDQIRAMRAFENTLILFLSDNGASAEIMVRGDGHDPEAPMGSAATYLCLGPGWSTASNTPFRRHKTWTHEGGPATPLVVSWPAGIEARGEWRHTPGHVIDVVPTVLEMAGIEGNWTREGAPEAPGRSLVPVFGGEAEGAPMRHEHLWWFHDGHRALRMGDWKLVSAKGEPWELFDLSADRIEGNDLAGSHPEKAAELAKRWQSELDAFVELAR